MKTLQKNDISLILKELMTNSLKREEASEMALEFQVLDLNNQLSFIRIEERPHLMDVIDFLVGIDLKISETEYLYSHQDIKDYFEKF